MSEIQSHISSTRSSSGDFSADDITLSRTKITLGISAKKVKKLETNLRTFPHKFINFVKYYSLFSLFQAKLFFYSKATKEVTESTGESLLGAAIPPNTREEIVHVLCKRKEVFQQAKEAVNEWKEKRGIV